MSAATTMPPTFSGEELTQLLALIKDSDSVELKLTVPETDQRSAVARLGLDPLEAQIRQIFFFDTPDLALDKQGVVVRARRIQGKGDDSAVKLRPVVPAELPDDLRRSAAFRVEVDALPGGYVCSGALKGALRPTDVARAVAGELPLRKLFSKEQRAFFAAHVQDGVGFDDLAILGPIFVLKLKLDAGRAGTSTRRRDVALPGRFAGARALGSRRDRRGVPSRGRAPQLPHRQRDRPLGRAGDEDPQGAHVLLEAEAEGSRHGGSRPGPQEPEPSWVKRRGRSTAETIRP